MSQGFNRSIKKNYLYNAVSQIVNLITPLITTPYVSKVLGAENIGAISYTQSIINYLTIFSLLGTAMFAVRQIAYYRGAKEKQEAFISNILCLKAIIMIPALFAYVGFVLFYTQYSKLFLAEGAYLIAEIINIDWIYSGNENFRLTVAKNIFIKTAGIVLIFLFVKGPSDVYLYAFILGASMLVGNLSLWRRVVTEFRFVKPSLSQMKTYFIGGLVLLVPQIAGTLYVYFDKIMIGLLTQGDLENGYYEQSQKVIRLSITVITALPTVMLPRISAAFSQKQNGLITQYMEKSMKLVFFISIPMVFGLIGISGHLVPWFFGDEYGKVAVLLKIVSPIILFNAIYSVISYQYLLAVKKEKVFTYTILLGAATNVFLNYLLIPKTGSIGASVSSLMAESIVSIVQLILFRKIVRFVDCTKSICHALFAGVVMFAAISYVGKRVPCNITGTFVLIAIGIVVYMLLQFLMGDENIKYVLSILQNNLRYRKK